MDGEHCEVCGSLLDFESCWECAGEGGYHDCGDDTCPCLHPEDDYWWDCETCDGEGGYLVCPNAASHWRYRTIRRARQNDPT